MPRPSFLRGAFLLILIMANLLSPETLAEMQAKTREYYLDSTGRKAWQAKAEGELYNLHEAIDTCAVFGCGRHLTLLENLAGRRCIEHSKVVQRPDVTHMVSY